SPTNLFHGDQHDRENIAKVAFGPGFPLTNVDLAHLDGANLLQFSLQVNPNSSTSSFSLDSIWLECILRNDLPDELPGVPKYRDWLIGSFHNQPNVFKTSGYASQNNYYVDDAPAEFESGIDQPSTQFPDQINATTMTDQNIIFSQSTDLGGAVELQ